MAGEICETLLQRSAAERWHRPIVRARAKGQVLVIGINIVVARALVEITI